MTLGEWITAAAFAVLLIGSITVLISSLIAIQRDLEAWENAADPKYLTGEYGWPKPNPANSPSAIGCASAVMSVSTKKNFGIGIVTRIHTPPCGITRRMAIRWNIMTSKSPF